MSAIPDKNNEGNAVWAIVLMYGGEAITRSCIESLLAQDHPLTVLLVDNASPDGSGERLRRALPSIQHLSTGSNLGYAAGNNRGAAYAIERGATDVIIVNNDTVLERDCVSVLVASAREANKLGALCPKILYYDDPRRIWYAGGDYSVARAVGRHHRFKDLDDAQEPPRLEEVSFATGCCVLIPADVYRATGGFREDFFMYCEDVELSFRLTRAGYRLYYQPAARIRHRHRLDITPSPSAITYRDRNRRRLVREHYNARDRLLFAAWFYPTRILRFAQYVLSGRWSNGRAIIAGMFAR